jgi:outer membrane protein assembly factor BamB
MPATPVVISTPIACISPTGSIPVASALAPSINAPNLLKTSLVTKLWEFKMLGGEPVYSSPIGPVNVRIPGPITKKAVIVNSWDWWSYALDAVTGAQLWRRAAGLNRYGRSSAADIDGDGLVEILSPSHDGNIYFYEDDSVVIGTFGNVYARKGSGTITARTATTLTDSAKNWVADTFIRDNTVLTGNANLSVPSVAYTGKIQATPGGDTLTISPAFTTLPAVGAAYTITPAFASDIVFMHAPVLTQEAGVWYAYGTGFDNMVYKINANTRAVIWERATRENIEPYPLLADINNDGVKEVLVVSIDGFTRCLNSATGAVIWQTNTGQCDAFLNAADVNNDGLLEVIVSSRDNRVYILNGQTGALLDQSTDCGAYDYGDIDSSATPILLPGETTPRIFVGGDGGTVWCLDKNCNTEWNRFVAPQAINSSPLFHDVNGDGVAEGIIADMRGTLYVFDLYEGDILGQIYHKGGIEGSPLYADIDGDGKMEMVVTTTDGYVIAYRFNNGAEFTTTYLPGNAKYRGFT